VYLASDGDDSDPMCSRERPCRTVRRGLEVATGTRTLIVLAAGDYRTEAGQSLVIDRTSAEPVTLRGPGASLSRADAGPVLQIQGIATRVVLDGVRLHGGIGIDGHGVACFNQAAVTLRGVALDSNQGVGVFATSCAVTIERSRFGATDAGAGNAGGGLSTSRGVIVVRNSVFVGNGTAVGPEGTAFGGVFVDRPQPGSVFELNSLIDNLAIGDNPASIDCRFNVEETFAVTSSIAVGATDFQVGARCLPSYFLSNQGLDRGTDNLKARPTLLDRYHLAPLSAGIGAGDPALTATPTTDIDGELRPRPVATRPDIGADEVAP
jgi:hypothetical protein